MGTKSSNPNLESWHRLNQLSDEELASELLVGRHDALIILFDRYHKLIFRVALRIVHDPGEAEDVVQTVFFEAFRNLANFNPQRGTLKVWLLQYAYGRSLNRQRHLASRRFYDSLNLEHANRQITWPFPAALRDISRLTEQLLGALSPRRRKIIELTYFEGLTAEEIAEHLKLNVGVVRHELYRGIRKLRRTLQGGNPKAEPKAESHGKEALTPDAQPL